jgi:hypothetical protein
MNKHITEEFEASIKKGVITGSLKFSNKFVSQIQVFSATKEWAKDNEGLIYASVRTDGADFIALDFRYDENKEGDQYNSFLHDFLKPLFEEKLGKDYIQAWSVSRESVIVR